MKLTPKIEGFVTVLSLVVCAFLMVKISKLLPILVELSIVDDILAVVGVTIGVGLLAGVICLVLQTACFFLFPFSRLKTSITNEED